MQCDFSKIVPPSLVIQIPYDYDTLDWLEVSIASKDCMVDQVMMMALWKIWQMRNNVIFKAGKRDPCFVAQEIWDVIEETNGVIGRGPNMALSVGNYQQIGNSWIVQSDAGCFLMVRLCWNVLLRIQQQIFFDCYESSFYPCKR